MRRALAAVVVLVGTFGVPATASAQVAGNVCRFVLGFGALQSAIPLVVGDCVTEEQHNPQNGDALQQTTNGLLVWRKVDDFTAFTDGFHSWVQGPFGVQERLNTERFAWEANPDGLPLVPAGSALVPQGADQPAAQAGCVATVQASVKYPQLGGGTQTLYVTADDASGAPVAGAQGSAYVQYRTTSRSLALTDTDAGGNTAASWNVGGPRGTVGITVTETSGGCTATGSTSFQGR